MKLIRYMPEFIRRPWRQLQERRLARSPFWTTFGAGAPIRFLDSRIAIHHQRRYIYFRIPKAANSTVVASLYASDTAQGIAGRDEMMQVKKHHYACPSVLKAAEVAHLAGYTTFIIARHPVRRLLSAYRDKIVRKKSISRRVFRALGRDRATSEISIAEFVGYLEDGGLMADPHWMPQRFFLPQGFRPVDEIGRVETLAEDLPRILGRIYPQGFTLAEHRPHATGADQVEIEPALAGRIAALYAEDFAVFGYQR